MPRDAAKPVVIRPLPPQPPASRWRAFGQSIPSWVVLALFPVLAVVLGTVLAEIGTP